MKEFTGNPSMKGRNGNGRVLRTSGLIAVLAGAVLLTGACSKDPVKQPAVGGTTDRRAQAVDYAKCMRDNGDPAWPDPGPDGAFPNKDGSLDRTSAAYQKANEVCKGKEPQAGAAAAAAAEEQFQKLLAYSKCMRENGVSKFPDPVKEDGGVGIDTGKDIDTKSAAYKSAARACLSLQVGPAPGSN